MRLGLVALLSLLLLYSGQAWAGKRVALIIANSHYEHVTSLDTPLADAAVVKVALVQIGFAVTFVRDGTKADIEGALRTFGGTADGAEIALVYYAGHGIAVDGENFLIPVDAQLAQARDTRLEAIPFSTLDAVAQNAQRRMIVLDACRNNPFAAGRAVGGGLTAVEPIHGTLVMLSTRAGRVAQDGDETNSPFAASFARHVGEAGVEVNAIFRKVRDDVMRDTSGNQEPVTFGALSGEDFYLANPSRPALAPSPSLASRDDEQVELYLWRGAIEANSPESFADYLQRYPSGRFAIQARENVRRLQGMAVAQSAPVQLAMSRSPTPMPEAPRPAVVTQPVVAAPLPASPAPQFQPASPAPQPQPVSPAPQPQPVVAVPPPSVVAAPPPAPAPIVLASSDPLPTGPITNQNYVTPEVAMAGVGARPMFATLPSAALPGHFCSAEARNDFYATVLTPAKDLANQNNAKAIAYLEQIQSVYQHYQTLKDAVAMTTLSRESTAYQTVAAEAYRISAALADEYNGMMAVPITACGSPPPAQR